MLRGRRGEGGRSNAQAIINVVDVLVAEVGAGRGQGRRAQAERQASIDFFVRFQHADTIDIYVDGRCCSTLVLSLPPRSGWVVFSCFFCFHNGPEILLWLRVDARVGRVADVVAGLPLMSPRVVQHGIRLLLLGLLRGIVLNRTYGTYKKLYNSLFSRTLFGPIYYTSPVVIESRRPFVGKCIGFTEIIIESSSFFLFYPPRHLV